MDKAMELLGKAILGAVDLLTKAAKAVGKAIVDGVVGALAPLAQGVKDIFNTVGSWISSWTSNAAKQIKTGKGMYDKAAGYVPKAVAPYSGKPSSQLLAPWEQTQGATGGLIKGEGSMYVHPNELLVNDSLTQKLAGFLGGTTNNNQASSVTFSEGSINIMASNSSSQEAKKLAREVIQEIDKQRQLSNIMSYKLPS